MCQCAACRAHHAQVDEMRLLHALLAQHVAAPRRTPPVARRAHRRPLRMAGATLLAGGALALVASLGSAAAVAAPALPAVALAPHASRPALAPRDNAALLRALLDRPVTRAEARAARGHTRADAALLRALLDRPVSRAEARAARGQAIDLARAPLAAGQELVIPAAPQPALAAQAQTSYVVKSGDSLWSIAARLYGNGALWQTIYNANREVVGSNPNLIYPDQRFTIPAAPTTPTTPSSGSGSAAKPGASYTIVSGDTLTGIAFAAYGNANRWQDIYTANRAAVGSNPNLIFPGTVLSIPK
ncbi:MAG: LysM peptidoglycan-binding domain-containing protein [Kouleothrix sp.]|nr:LysM peptidoglycan-binding domain-containing protein [Kouleothrix sp.]